MLLALARQSRNAGGCDLSFPSFFHLRLSFKFYYLNRVRLVPTLISSHLTVWLATVKAVVCQTMMSIASSSESSETNASTLPPRSAHEPEFQCIRQGKAVDRALAIKLDKECMYRWGEAIYDRCYPGTRTTDSPEVVRKKYSRLALGIAQHMAYETYCRFPGIPRFRRNVLLVPRRRGRSREFEMMWLFVLRDNSSQEALQAPLVTEEVEAAMEFLGVENKGVKWYDVTSRVNGACRALTVTDGQALTISSGHSD